MGPENVQVQQAINSQAFISFRLYLPSKLVSKETKITDIFKKIATAESEIQPQSQIQTHHLSILPKRAATSTTERKHKQKEYEGGDH